MTAVGAGATQSATAGGGAVQNLERNEILKGLKLPSLPAPGVAVK
jgi:hypothetical protein